MVTEQEKRSFSALKGQLQSRVERELSQGEAVEMMADLASEHLHSCDADVPREYRRDTDGRAE